jgi:hypothetical protein
VTLHNGIIFEGCLGREKSASDPIYGYTCWMHIATPVESLSHCAESAPVVCHKAGILALPVQTRSCVPGFTIGQHQHHPSMFLRYTGLLPCFG